MHRSTNSRGIWAVGITVIVVVILALITGIYTVPAGHVGIITRWGAVLREAQPGLGFKLPVADDIKIMDVRTQKDQVDTSAASQDLQTVTSTIASNYHLDSNYALLIYQTIGLNYIDTVIAPAIQNTWKATTAQFTAQQLIQNREEVRQKAEDSLKTQLAAYHVIVENFNIVNFDFSPEYDAAVEAKQVAQQQVQTAQQLQDKAKIDAQTVVIAAQGQADAQKALKDTGALSQEYLNYLALQKWNGILPTVTGGAIPFIQVPIVTTTNP
jgi:regulator of protease activity HflC (stomatin/prohibitin superfamily)